MNYEITFLKPRAEWNWVTVSSISKDVFSGFLDYLYNLGRDIEVQPYIPGGYASPMHIRDDLDRTYLVEQIVKLIKEKKPFTEIFKVIRFINAKEEYETDTFFIEDVYELYLSLGVPQDIALHYANEQIRPSDERSFLPIYKEDKRAKPFIDMFEKDPFYFPFSSRYKFIYMFRNEFVRYMKTKGYDDVSVEGGWILNDKEREMELGIIDVDGHFLK